MNKFVKLIIKGVVTGSMMIAGNEVISYHANPYKAATLTRLACNIAGIGLGFTIGKEISEEIIYTFDGLIDRYTEVM